MYKITLRINKTVVESMKIAGSEKNEPVARYIPVLNAQINPEMQPTVDASLIFIDFFISTLPTSLYIF